MPEAFRPTILLTGAAGQVGWELARTLPELGSLLALDRNALDLEDLEAVRATVRAIGPDIIVNAAAYTMVDKAESEPALAHRINAEAAGTLASEAERFGAAMVHYSTDYVFDGNGTRPYRETDAPAPCSVYGASKLAGEEAVLGNASQAYIFRLAWVYDNRGRNFLKTMQRLARERDELRVVADQFGTPTWARSVAEATTQVIRQIVVRRGSGQAASAPGIYHMASRDHTSWHGFAEAIVAAQPDGEPRPRVVGITTAEYPTPARRPSYSILDPSKLDAEFGIQLPSWREQLQGCLSGA